MVFQTQFLTQSTSILCSMLLKVYVYREGAGRWGPMAGCEAERPAGVMR